MRAFFTTEQELIRLLESSDDNIWKQILRKQQCVFLSSDWDENNELLSAFHRSGVQIHSYPDFFERINEDHELMTKLGTPIYLLDITKDKAEEISREYGLCCYAIEDRTKPFISIKGWDIETSDEDKPKNWDYFYDNVFTNCNCAIIVDRYLFACDYNKKNNEPDEIIQDSYDNLEQIMKNILPKESKCRFILTIIFSYSSNKGGMGEDDPTMTEIIEEIQNIKNRIGFPYEIDIEVLSVDKGCAYYNDTHDRFVITNYSITEATHKIKAFRAGNVALCKQKLSFNYTYSKGIEDDDKSSLPAATQERILNALRNYINDKKNKSKIKYAINGEVYSLNEKNVLNKLLTSTI